MVDDPSLPGPIAAYGFNEGSGAVLGDNTGNARQGTISGAAWTASGRFGSALSFNGTNSLVTIADANALDLTNGMTLEAWVRPTTINGWETVVLKESSNDLAYALYADNNGNDSGGPRRPNVSIRQGSATYMANGTSQLTLNAWTHLAATYDGSVLRQYVNGVLVSSLNRAGAINVSGGALRIGGNNIWGEWFNGLIDEVRIYNRPLSQPEIQVDMITPVVPSPPSNPNPQATFSAGSANEGGTTQVSFSNPTGGYGAYLYSFDFDNNGTYEITDGASATAMVPASYLSDGPGARSVRGRIKDSASGVFTTYTASVTIANVPPTVAFGGPFAAAPGTPISFAATVTDPSPVDTSAGFTYSWNFGDGTANSTLASPSHAYSAAGTYTLSLTVQDKDGGATTVTTTVGITTGSPPQATFTGGSANEGSTGQVSFSNPSGGSGGYWYSFDFDNNGTFDVSDSTSPTATVPASYLSDGPGSRIVRGRIRDSSGMFANYTATVSIANVPPTAQISGPYSNIPGAAIAFSANVSDPSPTDTTAGFTYTWNFGDGTATSTAAAPSHAYSAAGTYTVTLTVRDKDAGTATATSTVTVSTSTSATIVTPYDTIPNFGRTPTIIAAQSGNWSSASTWSLGRLPAAGDVVSIGGSMTVVYDAFSDVAVKTVAIQPGGTLQFRTDINTRLTVINLLVMQGGTLQIGTTATPVAAAVKAEVLFADVALDTVNDPAQYGNGLVALGNVTMHGALLSDTFVRLAAEPLAGQTTLTLAAPVTGWKVGDKLLIPDTRQLRENERGGAYVPQWETPIISAISANGTVLTLSAPLQFNHRGARSVSGSLDYLPHVANSTHNVVVRSQNMNGTRGQVMFLHRANVDVRYVQFGGLGRTTMAATDNTTFNGSGAVTHIGTNQEDRNPVQFRHLIGPGTAQSNGYQYTFIGNTVQCPLTPMTFVWGININDSSYGLLRDNVLYNWAGAGLVTKTGTESYNRLEHNFVMRVSGNSERTGGFFQGDGYWIRNPLNYVVNNVATNINGGGPSAYSYGFGIDFTSGGVVSIPSYQGADRSVSGQSRQVNINGTPLIQFSGNEVYGASLDGISAWWLGTSFESPLSNAGTILNCTVWHHSVWGLFAYESNNLVIDGYTVRGDPSALNVGTEHVKGLWAADYMQRGLVIRNANIQGMMTGIMTPLNGGHNLSMATTTIESSYLNNVHNILKRPPSSVNGNAGLAPMTLVVRNVRFNNPPVPAGWEVTNIQMMYNPPNDGMGQINYSVADLVYVYDYNGVIGDNFQVFYSSGSGRTTRSGIDGYVVPM